LKSILYYYKYNVPHTCILYNPWPSTKPIQCGDENNKGLWTFNSICVYNIL